MTYARIRKLLESGIPLGRIVHLNFEDDRLRLLSADRKTLTFGPNWITMIIVR